MIFNTAYDTTACNGYVPLLHITTDAILKSAISDSSLDNNIKKAKDVWCMTDVGTAEVAPAFAHPIVFDREKVSKTINMFGTVQSHDNRFFTVIDVRPFGKWDDRQYKFMIRNSTEFNLAVLRASLNEYWVNSGTSPLETLSTLPMTVYASWISENVSRRFALDSREQANLAVYACYFYLGLFTNDEKLSEPEKNRYAAIISKATRVNANEVFDIIDKTEPPQTIVEFCTRAEAVIGSVRLKGFDVRVLYAIVGGTWFGTNSKELTAVALEHPPTWMAILAAAFSERSFTNSGITKLTERASNREAGKNYVRQVFNLVQFEA